MPAVWTIDGKPTRHLDVEDRGFQYGDGLFETIAIRRHQPRFLAEHLDRLYTGCTRLGIRLPDRAHLAGRLRTAGADLDCGVLKLVVSRGAGRRGYAVPADVPPTLAWSVEATRLLPSAPLTVRWCRTPVSLNTALAGMKTLGRLEQVLARAEWDDPAVGEGLMCDGEGLVAGATAGNVFLVMADRLRTPDLSRCGVHGIMRRVTMEQAQRLGIHCDATRIRPADLAEASEVFITSALTGIRPVAALGDRRWAAPGPVTGALSGRLAALGVDECAGC